MRAYSNNVIGLICYWSDSFASDDRLIHLFVAVAGTGLRHGVDKYLDRRRPVATAADRVAIDHFQKSQSQDGGLSKLLLAYSHLNNHSEAGLVTPKQDVGDR